MFKHGSIIVLSNFLLLGYRAKHGSLELKVRINLSKAPIAGIREFVSARGTGPVYLLLDFLEEEFRIETIPHIRGRDRNRMLERKLSQSFKGRKLRRAEFTKRLDYGRRDDEYLFSSIPNIPAIEALFSLLYSLEVPIAGVFSAPLLTSRLFSHLPQHEHTLVLLAIDNDNADLVALRQCYYKNNALMLSRLITIPAGDPSTLADGLQEEVRRTRRYLLQSKQITDDGHLNVLFVMDSLSDQKLQQRAIQLGSGFAFELTRAKTVALNIGLKSTNTELLLDGLLAFWLSRQSFLRSHYRTHESGFHFRHVVARRGLVAASLVLSGGILATSAYYANQGREAQALLEQQIRQHDRMQASLTRMEDSMPAVPVAPDQMQAAVRVTEHLLANRVTPGSVLNVVSQVLKDHRDLTIERLSWEVKRAADGQQGNLQIDPITGLAIDMPETKAPGSRIVGRLEGQLNPRPADLRVAMARIEAFRQQLAAHPNVADATAVRLPVDAAPEAELSGRVDGAQSPTGGEFELEFHLVFDHETEASI